MGLRATQLNAANSAVVSYSISPNRSFRRNPTRPRRFRCSPWYFAKYTKDSKAMPRNSITTGWPYAGTEPPAPDLKIANSPLSMSIPKSMPISLPNRQAPQPVSTKPTDHASKSPGKGSFLVAEQLPLNQIRIEPHAVEGHERPSSSAAGVVYAARDEVFARARLADDEDAQDEACGNLDVSPDFPHQVGLANKSTNCRRAVYAFHPRLSTLSGFWTMTICLHKVESSSMTIEKKRNTSL